MARGDLLIGDIFANAAATVPGRVAIAAGGARRTFAELDREADAVARVLAAAGLGRGDLLLTWCGTDLRLVALFVAAARLGAVLAPVNGALGADELAPVVETAQPALVLTAAPATLPGAPTLTLDELARRAAADEGPPGPGFPGPGERDPHVVFFTSGSSGRPKGVVLSHRVSYLRTHPGALLEPRGAMVCPYPLFHMAAWTIALQQWQARDTVVLVPSDAAAICDAVTAHRATRLNCVPAVWRRILDHLADGGGPGRLATLRFADTGTSATPLPLLQSIAGACPQAQVRVFYGSTEAGSVAALEHADMARKPGSCGVAGPGVALRTDAEGVLWVRSPLLFDGYLHDPAATDGALVDGWFRTGDLAECDGEGYWTITGRAGEVIRTGGESVAPAEVEVVLLEAPGVADAAVVGLPDPDWGEVVCAVVVAAPGTAPPNLAALRAHCTGRLAPFKHPRRLVLVDEIPRTASTRQVQRRLLVERLG